MFVFLSRSQISKLRSYVEKAYRGLCESCNIEGVDLMNLVAIVRCDPVQSLLTSWQSKGVNSPLIRPYLLGVGSFGVGGVP